MRSAASSSAGERSSRAPSEREGELPPPAVRARLRQQRARVSTMATPVKKTEASQRATDNINLKALKRIDAEIEGVKGTASHVVLYDLSSGAWVRRCCATQGAHLSRQRSLRVALSPACRRSAHIALGLRYAGEEGSGGYAVHCESVRTTRVAQLRRALSPRFCSRLPFQSVNT